MRLLRVLFVALLMSGAAAVLFGVIAETVVNGRDLTHFDQQLADDWHAHAHANPGMVTVMRSFTFCGDRLVLEVLGLAVTVVLLLLIIFKRQRRLFLLSLALIWILALAGAALLNNEMKVAFARERPHFLDSHFVKESSRSFPSGHAMTGIVAYTMLGYLLVLAVKRAWQRWLIVAGFTLLVIGIGVSRVYLGAHWLTDVLGGLCAGAAWVILMIGVGETVRRGRREAMNPPAVAPAAIS